VSDGTDSIEARTTSLGLKAYLSCSRTFKAYCSSIRIRDSRWNFPFHHSKPSCTLPQPVRLSAPRKIKWCVLPNFPPTFPHPRSPESAFDRVLCGASRSCSNCLSPLFHGLFDRRPCLWPNESLRLPNIERVSGNEAPAAPGTGQRLRCPPPASPFFNTCPARPPAVSGATARVTASRPATGTRGPQCAFLSVVDSLSAAGGSSLSRQTRR